MAGRAGPQLRAEAPDPEPDPAPGRVPARAPIGARPERRQLTLGGGAFAMLLAAIWGGNPVAVKEGLKYSGPIRLAMLRMSLGGIAVAAYALATRQSIRPTRRELLPLAGIGLLFIAQTSLMYLGGDRTTAGHAVVLTSTHPLWAAVFAHFLVPGDRMTRRRALGTLIAYSGVVVVFAGDLTGEEGVGLDGDLMLVVQAALLGARLIYISQASQNVAPVKLLAAQAAFAVPAFAAISAGFETQPWQWPWELIAALLYQGLVIAGFGFIGNAWLLQRYLPSRVAATQISTPFFGVILSWLVLGEAIGYELIAGVALLTLGSALVQQREAERAAD